MVNILGHSPPSRSAVSELFCWELGLNFWWVLDAIRSSRTYQRWFWLNPSLLICQRRLNFGAHSSLTSLHFASTRTSADLTPRRPRQRRSSLRTNKDDRTPHSALPWTTETNWHNPQLTPHWPGRQKASLCVALVDKAHHLASTWTMETWSARNLWKLQYICCLWKKCSKQSPLWTDRMPDCVKAQKKGCKISCLGIFEQTKLLNRNNYLTIDNVTINIFLGAPFLLCVCQIELPTSARVGVEPGGSANFYDSNKKPPFPTSGSFFARCAW